MQRVFLNFLYTLSCTLLILSAPLVSAKELAVGDMAPEFTLPASDGKTYTLSDYRDKQVVILAWYPKAYTRGCTIECKSLTDDGDKIRAFDVVYFMASVDELVDTTRFANQTLADFPLLSDEDKQVATAYDVLMPLISLAKRHTYYIGKDGRILKIDTDIHPETSATDIAKTLEELGVDLR